MEKVYQVFVSSTYSDLKDERRHVSETLAKAGYIPAGMELFPAADQQQLEFIKRVIDRCDYYVVILGGRYGSLADDTISFTEKEYDYALEHKIPVLAFLHASPDKIEVGKTDRDQEQEKKLAAFRAKLSKGRIIDFWHDRQDLCTKVVIAVAQAINLSPGVGWIRGDQAIDPKIIQDLERLRMENNALRQQIAGQQDAEIVFPPDLLGPQDPITMRLQAIAKGTNTTQDVKVTPEFVMRVTINLLTEEAMERTIKYALAKAYSQKTLDRFDPSATYEFSGESMMQMRFQLEALKLIKAVSGAHGIIWTLTDTGRRYVSSLFALRKKQAG
jgi:hypothetical protein